MKIVILSDVHGNVIFLNRCLKEINKLQPDRIIALGDYFGYLPGGREVLAVLLASSVTLLKGNHEAMMLGELPLSEEKDRKYYHLKDAFKTLSECDLKTIRKMPNSMEYEIDGNRLLFIHGSTENYLNGYMYEDGVIAQDIDKQYDCIFMGHTHRPFIKRKKGVLYVNVGSCGLPRDVGNEPSFCFFDTVTREAEIMRVRISSGILENPVYKSLNKDVYNVFFRRARE